MADSRDELYNASGNAMYWQMYVAYVLFVFKIVIYNVPDNSGWCTSNGTHTTV
jgi:hypothetical protein